MKKWLKRAAAAMATLLVLATLAAANFLRSFNQSLPVYNGSVAVDGLSAPVEILRDRHGVPHILARTREDAAFAEGYAHAQDRLWQMETARRFVQGRLAELFGSLVA